MARFFVWVIEDPKLGPQASPRGTLSAGMSSHIKMYLLSNNVFELYSLFRVHYAQAALMWRKHKACGKKLYTSGWTGNHHRPSWSFDANKIQRGGGTHPGIIKFHHGSGVEIETERHVLGVLFCIRSKMIETWQLRQFYGKKAQIEKYWVVQSTNSKQMLPVCQQLLCALRSKSIALGWIGFFNNR